ncbi:hypothetical protein EYC80_005321 [Monilinia laxa]|uniref:Uncharacterized protein n=1 Tax=Monilinia laxa TaxID=61186 RepID=A0A5N6KJV0_MONLA|nr:hypothetical protein EYC80_005321 [Monilinia laxa]
MQTTQNNTNNTITPQPPSPNRPPPMPHPSNPGRGPHLRQQRRSLPHHPGYPPCKPFAATIPPTPSALRYRIRRYDDGL